MDRTQAITAILVALIGAGLLSFVRDAIRAWRAKRHADSPIGRDSLHVDAADQSLLVVVKARDELEEDNRRLRLQLGEERRMRAEDNAAARQREINLRAEIDQLEQKVRDILREVEELRNRHRADM